MDTEAERVGDTQRAEESGLGDGLPERLQRLDAEVVRLRDELAASRRLARTGIELTGWLVFGLAVAVLYRVDLPPSAVWTMVTNSGHVAVFGVIAVATLRMSVGIIGPSLRPRLWHYVLSLGVCAVLGMALEAIQIIGPRDASWDDVVRDLLGATGGLVLALTFDRVAGRELTRLPRLAIPLRLLAVALILSGFVPMVSEALSQMRRNAAFPSLASFDQTWEERFLNTSHADLAIVPAPPAWTGARGRVGRVSFHVGDYPALQLAEPVTDWTGYHRLAFTVFNPTDRPIELALRIHDERHNGRPEDRFGRRFTVAPGVNELAVDLEEVRNAPVGRTLDLEAVDGVLFFLDYPAEPVDLYLDSIRLE